MAGQFPGGQGALIAGASLIDPNMQRDAGVGGLINRAGGGPQSTVASQPALQWVKTHRFAGRLGVRDFSNQAAAMFADPRLMATSSSAISSARRRPPPAARPASNR